MSYQQHQSTHNTVKNAVMYAQYYDRKCSLSRCKYRTETTPEAILKRLFDLSGFSTEMARC